MYDMKTPQIPTNNKNKEQYRQKLNKLQQQQQQQQQQQENNTNNLNEQITAHYTTHLTTTTPTTTPTTYKSSCSIIKLPLNSAIEELYQTHQPHPPKPHTHTNPADTIHMSLLKLRRRRWLVQRHACLLSILLAFIFGMALGILLPMFGWSQVIPTFSYIPDVEPIAATAAASAVEENRTRTTVFPNIYDLQPAAAVAVAAAAQQLNNNAFSVAFIKEQLPQQQKTRIALPLVATDENSVPLSLKSVKKEKFESKYIKQNIYWGDEVEKMLPRGFTPEDSRSWNKYLRTQGIVSRLETGCGRMQNRLIIFADGTRACARYRQNTDQIQGELFSFYLGQLMNLSNLAPSAAAVVDLNSTVWEAALPDITQAQWKQQRPVVLTQWLSELEPAGIPLPFQSMDRHLNKYDVWNMTDVTHKPDLKVMPVEQKNSNPNELIRHKIETTGLMKRLANEQHKSLTAQTLAAEERLKRTLIELAQWSDLIVFDYLIANLDRVVNNLYNFQWNADIMAAPAHNLARQTYSQLLVFLDNESGLLHGYRLLKKYEAYHSLLLDNLCVFRKPTIMALRELRAQGVGRRLTELFESTTTQAVRDVLPSLPDKSIKILGDRIDRVLGQVQKCSDLLIDR